jgi:hypothetical protein
MIRNVKCQTSLLIRCQEKLNRRKGARIFCPKAICPNVFCWAESVLRLLAKTKSKIVYFAWKVVVGILDLGTNIKKDVDAFKLFFIYINESILTSSIIVRHIEDR